MFVFPISLVKLNNLNEKVFINLLIDSDGLQTRRHWLLVIWCWIELPTTFNCIQKRSHNELTIEWLCPNRPIAFCSTLYRIGVFVTNRVKDSLNNKQYWALFRCNTSTWKKNKKNDIVGTNRKCNNISLFALLPLLRVSYRQNNYLKVSMDLKNMSLFVF